MSEHLYSEEEVKDLTDRVFLLRQSIEEGKIHFASHLVGGFIESYEAIRLRSDGLVDPSSVDGRIRGATLALRHFKYRDEAKSAISTGEIQNAYFEMLFVQFGWILDFMVKNGLNPHQASVALMRDADFVKQVRGGLPELAAGIRAFWDQVAEAGAFHLQDGQQLKATFSGDLFPAHWENVVSTAGLYIDTIVLPCPILRIAPILGIYPDDEVARLFVKHVLTAMTYRDVATADVAPPIALILPHPDDIRRGENNGLFTRAEPAILKHAAYLFNREFQGLSHYQEFCSTLRTVSEIMAELKGADRLLFDTAWEPGAEAQLTRMMRDPPPVIFGLDREILGNHLFAASAGRMPQALASQEVARHFGGTPFIGAETSWQYYKWFLDYESISSNEELQDRKSAHVTRALVAEGSRNLSWLGNVPPETVLEIRRNGHAEDLRKILSAGLDELILLKPDNYYRTSDRVVENLNRAFEQHERQLLEARNKKLKLFGIDVGSFVATGSIAVTAALTSNPTLGAASGILGILGLPNLREIRSKFKEQAAADLARKNSPTGLLFKHVKS
ncbi:hypothetical protein [Xanthomonas campestris]|uniref:hypothetical protein n=1 Tax=Xanthomonas campestris TaxID=339 RepID=UPI0008A610DF|nr:hypothetical protein [Xanthomonas campestris]MEB1153538.1 hypothetical protein [Xanthomonas campestris pv. campestris]MCC5099424.1 hypothetical protein [Xanthomonas campestris]MEA9585638.1 hypothetical protein [Xanthomonas campestris]MEA9594081.1 hypothetical protein [Xanthomonas campestris]MEA9625526.1 hypothetical protein [Xanthomonas campestris]